MAQLISLFLLWAHAQTLQLINEQSFESEKKFQEIKFGGVSGLHYKDDILWALSDDRGGRAGPPRLYKLKLISSADKKNWSVEISEMHNLGDHKKFKVLDPESIHVFPENKVLISSEGDLNQKPRVMPMISFWDEKKKWEKELPLPMEVYPEKTGMQTKGIQNNGGFEAMAVQDDDKKIWIMPEFPLAQEKENKIPVFEYELQKNKSWKRTKKFNYVRETPQGRTEILRGLSEALYWKPDHLLILERSLRLGTTSVNIVEAELFDVNFSKGKVEKKKLLTLDNKLAANWEGLSWGPKLPDGNRLLIIVSDNNFAKDNPSRFLFYSFKE